jgi:L-aminopeptidase/D-esterase-like protein
MRARESKKISRGAKYRTYAVKVASVVMVIASKNVLMKHNLSDLVRAPRQLSLPLYVCHPSLDRDVALALTSTEMCKRMQVTRS